MALWGSIGLICGLTWLSGPFWCRRCGRRRHGDPAFYDRPENFVWRCRLLGAIAGIPSFIAVFAYYYSLAVVTSPGNFIPLGSIAAWVIVHTILNASIDSYYPIKAVISAPFLAAPFAFSAAIGACCGWLYGRFVRPAIRRFLPNLLPAL